MGQMYTKLPAYQLARATGGTPPLPFNYTLGMTGYCQSRCLSCNVWKRTFVGRDGKASKHPDDMTLEEWIKVFKSIGTSPFWVTLTGGEPFYNEEIVDVHDALVSYCKPSIINIPTNSLTSRVQDYVWEMLHRHPETRLVINVSIDHSDPKKNDVIRGIPGNYNKSMKVFQDLKALKHPSLSVGIHTVVSKFNVHDFHEICDTFLQLTPDQFITEIAEERVELHTVNTGITPSKEEYEHAISYLREKLKDYKWSGLSKITQAFRRTYYGNVIKNLQTHKQAIPCFAGYASCQINYEGTVWPCCVEAVPLGNLRQNNYDFGEIWKSTTTGKARERIRTGACQCPLANASYSNMMNNIPSLARVTKELVS